MYIENEEGSTIGPISKQHAERTAEAIEKDRKKGREFLQQMGEDDSDAAIDDLIEGLRE